MNTDLTNQALERVLSHYKTKNVDEINKIIDLTSFEFSYGDQIYEVEIEIDKKLEGVLRVMVLVSPRTKRFQKWFRGRAAYFGIKPDGTIIENDDMVF